MSKVNEAIDLLVETRRKIMVSAEGAKLPAEFTPLIDKIARSRDFSKEVKSGSTLEKLFDYVRFWYFDDVSRSLDELASEYLYQITVAAEKQVRAKMKK